MAKAHKTGKLRGVTPHGHGHKGHHRNTQHHGSHHHPGQVHKAHHKKK